MEYISRLRHAPLLLLRLEPVYLDVSPQQFWPDPHGSDSKRGFEVQRLEGRPSYLSRAVAVQELLVPKNFDA